MPLYYRPCFLPVACLDSRRVLHYSSSTVLPYGSHYPESGHSTIPSGFNTRPDLNCIAPRKLYDFKYLCPAVDIREYLVLNRPINASADGAGCGPVGSEASAIFATRK